MGYRGAEGGGQRGIEELKGEDRGDREAQGGRQGIEELKGEDRGDRGAQGGG